jgi:hypothetical protein
MTCKDAREAMLIADPSELRGRGDSPLTSHLIECIACRTLAGALVGHIGDLSSRLRTRSRRRTLTLSAVPIAAALIATITLAANRREHASNAPPRGDSPARVVSVDVAVGQHTTVITTADPKTTLVWISSGTH